MGQYYEKWIEREKEKAQEDAAKFRRKNIIIMILLIPICAAVVVALGWMSTGRLEYGLGNIKFGLIFALVMDVFMALIVFLSNPPKRFVRLLRKEADKELATDELKEDFAVQMLDRTGPDAVEAFTGKDSNKREDRVSVSKDYAIFESPNAAFTIVRLKDIRSIDLEISHESYRVGTGSISTRVNYDNFVINFFYRESTRRGNRPDRVFIFADKNLRDKVAIAVRGRLEAINGEAGA